MAEPTNQPDRQAVKDATAILADWAEEEGGFDSVDVDEQRAIVIDAFDRLEARLVAAETQQKQTIEHLRQLAHEFDKERRGLSVSGRINDLADSLAVLAAGRQEPPQ